MHITTTSRKKWIGLLGLIVFFGVIVYPMKTDSNLELERTEIINEERVLSAVGTTVKIYLLGANQSYTAVGNSFSFSGYTQKFDIAGSEGPGFYNTSGIPVYPIIDGIHYNGLDENENLTVLSGDGGIYTFVVDVNSTRSIHQDFVVWANITETPSQGIIVGDTTVQNLTDTHEPIFHDVVVESQIAADFEEGLEPVLVGDTYNINFTLSFTNNQSGVLTNNISVFQNTTDYLLNEYESIVTGVDGTGTFLFEQLDQLETIIIRFTGIGYREDTDGNPYYQVLPSQISLNPIRVTQVNAALNFSNAANSSADVVYRGGRAIIEGQIWANNNPEYILENTGIYIELEDGTPVGDDTTDAEGRFSITINLLNLGYNETDPLTFYISVENLDSGIDFSDDEEFVLIEVLFGEQPEPEVSIAPPEPTMNWNRLILPGIIAIVIVAGVIILQRFRMQSQVNQEFKLRKVDYTRFAIINLLYNQDRKREAIAYTYKIFADLINEKYGLIREPQQTLREFAIECVTRYEMDPLRTYPFISMVENIIYGAFDLNQRSFQKAITIFGRVFQEITGTSLDFTLEMSTSDQQEVTLKIGAVS